MRYRVVKAANGTGIQLILEGQNDKEDEYLEDLYLSGSIIAMGETDRGHKELVLSAPSRRP